MHINDKQQSVLITCILHDITNPWGESFNFAFFVKKSCISLTSLSSNNSPVVSKWTAFCTFCPHISKACSADNKGNPISTSICRDSGWPWDVEGGVLVGVAAVSWVTASIILSAGWKRVKFSVCHRLNSQILYTFIPIHSSLPYNVI